MTQDMFPIDGRGRTFNAAGVEVKLSPVMQRLVRALNAYGNVDPIRDFGRGTGVSTVVALIDRGILRESRTSRGVHFPATARAQVEHEAYAEGARIDAERAAHAADPERWVQADEGIQAHHVRATRDGGALHIYATGHNHWRIVVDGDMNGIGRSAGGTWQEARAAADRVERDAAQDDAINEDESRSIAKGKGWGQLDGMLNAPTAPAWTPAVGDTVLYGSAGVTLRPFGRVLLVDGTKVKVEWPGGVDWHAAHELEHHPMPSDKSVRAELEAQNTAADALLQADLRAGRADGKALPIVPRNVARYWIDSSKRGDEHTVKIMVTGPDAAIVRLIDELSLVTDDNPNIAALHAMLCDRTALVAKAWPSTPTPDAVPNTPVEAHAPRRCGRSEVHPGHDWPDIYKGGTYSCSGLPSTPAEGRTGVSDRVAAALADVADLRRVANLLRQHDRVGMLATLDRIEAALRGGR